MKKVGTLEKILPSLQATGPYQISRSNWRVTIQDNNGQPMGVIQFNGASEPRCVIWCNERLVGQAYLADKGWFVYPIDSGKLSEHPSASMDPLEFLLSRCTSGS